MNGGLHKFENAGKAGPKKPRNIFTGKTYRSKCDFIIWVTVRQTSGLISFDCFHSPMSGIAPVPHEKTRPCTTCEWNIIYTRFHFFNSAIRCTTLPWSYLSASLNPSGLPCSPRSRLQSNMSQCLVFVWCCESPSPARQDRYSEWGSVRVTSNLHHCLPSCIVPECHSCLLPYAILQ